jgi:AraC-like DNA-binding protein
MRFAIVPRPPLSHAVALLWYQDVVPGQFGPELVLPSGTAECVIGLGPPDHVRATGTVCGPHSTYFRLERPKVAHAVVGVHFRAGGLQWLLDGSGCRAASASELHNQIVTLEDLWGRDALLLHERLMEAQTPSLHLQVLEQALQHRFVMPASPREMVAAAVGLLRRTSSSRPVNAVADQLGYSVRRIQQQFQQAVGLSPKLFHRVSRFQTVLQAIDGLSTIDWSDVALAHGYFDQAHLVNDVRAFTSMAPTTLLLHQTAQTGHLRQTAPDPPSRP